MRPRPRVAHALKALEQLRHVGGRDADARVTDLELDAIAIRAKVDPDLALERELEGVREKIQHDLLPHVAIDVDRLSERRALDDEREPGLFDGRAEHARELRRLGG